MCFPDKTVQFPEDQDWEGFLDSIHNLERTIPCGSTAQIWSQIAWGEF